FPLFFGARHRARPVRPASTRLFLEHLEARCLPASGLSATLGADIAPGSGSSSPTELTNVNGTLFFTANDGIKGVQLWKSNGTAAGTVSVNTVKGDLSSPERLTNVNSTLFFAATDPQHGHELWKSDGTTKGTVLVKDITKGKGSTAFELHAN